MNWPNEPKPVSTIAAWCRKLLAACRASELKPGAGYRVRRTGGGTFLEFDENTGATCYIKVCLGDGTECYAPVVLRGRIFRSNGGTYATPTVTESDVPDGNQLLE